MTRTDLRGTVWEINDTGTRFYVEHVGDRYANVFNIGHRSGRNVPERPRRILVSTLKPSKSKTGYSRVNADGTVQ